MSNYSGEGGGAVMSSGTGKEMLISNSLFIKNIAAEGGALVHRGGQLAVKIINSTFASNITGSIPSEGICLADASSKSRITAEGSIIREKINTGESALILNNCCLNDL
jgi:hypothetical protein